MLYDMHRTQTAKSVFATNMRRRRLELGMTQERLSELTGLHRTYIGSVERGERNVSINNMDRIATALQTDLPVLLQSAGLVKMAV